MNLTALALRSATDANATASLTELHHRLAEFYAAEQTRGEYYELADNVNSDWVDHPYHRLITSLIPIGSRVVDLGCGSGHALRNLATRTCEYVGVDWSERQMRDNQRKFGTSGLFVSASLYETGLPDNSFDVAFSLYTLEHLVWPHRFLREVHRIVRPDGLIILLCPHFRPFWRIPSLQYGLYSDSVASLRTKVREFRLFDAVVHLFLRNIYYPQIIRRDYDVLPFLINLNPTCLQGRYYPDNDAVYMTDRSEVVEELANLGGMDIPVPLPSGVARSAKRSTLFVVFKKSSTNTGVGAGVATS